MKPKRLTYIQRKEQALQEILRRARETVNAVGDKNHGEAAPEVPATPWKEIMYLRKAIRDFDNVT